MLAISRELAWRRARRNWTLGCGHLPSEANSMADALSRLCAEVPAKLPAVLSNVPQRDAPELASFWIAASPPQLSKHRQSG